ncbi:MAG: hypothetical protein ACLTDO_07095 [Bifidobacterium pseudocatenulatum]
MADDAEHGLAENRDEHGGEGDARHDMNTSMTHDDFEIHVRATAAIAPMSAPAPRRTGWTAGR